MIEDYLDDWDVEDDPDESDWAGDAYHPELTAGPEVPPEVSDEKFIRELDRLAGSSTGRIREILRAQADRLRAGQLEPVPAPSAPPTPTKKEARVWYLKAIAHRLDLVYRDTMELRRRQARAARDLRASGEIDDARYYALLDRASTVVAEWEPDENPYPCVLDDDSPERFGTGDDRHYVVSLNALAEVDDDHDAGWIDATAIWEERSSCDYGSQLDRFVFEVTQDAKLSRQQSEIVRWIADGGSLSGAYADILAAWLGTSVLNVRKQLQKLRQKLADDWAGDLTGLAYAEGGWGLGKRELPHSEEGSAVHSVYTTPVVQDFVGGRNRVDSADAVEAWQRHEDEAVESDGGNADVEGPDRVWEEARRKYFRARRMPVPEVLLSARTRRAWYGGVK